MKRVVKGKIDKDPDRKGYGVLFASIKAAATVASTSFKNVKQG